MSEFCTVNPQAEHRFPVELENRILHPTLSSHLLQKMVDFKSLLVRNQKTLTCCLVVSDELPPLGYLYQTSASAMSKDFWACGEESIADGYSNVSCGC